MSAAVGELARDFSLPDTDARLRWLNEFHRWGPVVLIFLPSVNGLRPRWQLWSLLRCYDHFVNASTEIVVVAADPLPELRIFQIRRAFPFVFLSDRAGAVWSSYEIPAGSSAALVINSRGVIRHSHLTQFGWRRSGGYLLRVLHQLPEVERKPA